MSRHLVIESAADQLRAEILAGAHPPGTHLDEVSLAARLDVSRNTLREAFRLLAHERLVEHEPHRGVFVRSIDAAAARDAYEVRRHLECGGVREAFLRLGEAREALTRGPDAAASAFLARWESVTDAAEAAVRAGEAAAASGDWAAAGTANAEFHRQLARLGGNGALERTMEVLLTEARLRFLLLADPRAVHEPFVAENRRLLTLLRLGEGGRLGAELEAYLLRAEGLLASDLPLTRLFNKP